MKTTELRPHTTLRLLAGLFFVLMAATTFVTHAAPAGEKWNGKIADRIENAGGNSGDTADQPILIKDAAELAYLAQQVNAGSVADYYYFALSADIDLNGYEWTPIGNDAYPFKGHFNGDGHVVRGLKMNVEREIDATTYAGLFGHVENSTLLNLGVWLAPEGIEISSMLYNGDIYAGGLAGCVWGTDSKISDIRNCYVEAEGNVTVRIEKGAKTHVGGMVGATRVNMGSCIITHCYTTVDVEIESNFKGSVYVGGIVGRILGKTLVSYTYATGKMKVGEGRLRASTGGICGYVSNDGTITNNMALNKEISSPIAHQSNRIAGTLPSSSISATNYASSRMIVNGQPVLDNIDPASQNGADIWLDTFKEILQVPSDNNEWSTAWTQTDGELPHLKKLNPDGKTYSDDPMPGQETHPLSAYLYHTTWKSETNIARSIENAPPAGTSEPGDGLSPDKPILIKDAAELAYLAQQVEAGGYVLELENGNKINNESSSTIGFNGYYFALSANIKLDGGLWIPIGYTHVFCGHFDGKGHTVDGLRIDITGTYVGLFGLVVDGTICNLGVCLHEDGIKAASLYFNDIVFAGGIVGYLEGLNRGASLRNCFVVGNGKVEITAGDKGIAGGIAGGIETIDSGLARLAHCYSTVDVEATTEHQCYAGGIVGVSNGSLSYTYATGSVKTNNATEQSAGGICGRREGGELSRNLSLNSEVTVSVGSDSHRIAGFDSNPDMLPGFSDNYACPARSLSIPPVANDPADLDGANTWADQFGNDLQHIPALPPSNVNEWTTAWIWPDNPSGQPALLPQLKRLNPDGTYPDGSSSDDLLAGQPSLAIAEFLTTRPAPASFIENQGGGDGSDPDTPIRIRNAVELAYFARQVNNGGQTLQILYGKSIDNTAHDDLKGFAGYYFALSVDIDLKGQNWTPIGNEDSPFKGNFDGDGHVVRGLKVSIHNESDANVYAGLFGYVQNSTLCNLGVWLAPEGIEVFSSQGVTHAGGLAGYVLENSDIYNCYVEAEENGTIRSKGTEDNDVRIGGIAGSIYAKYAKLTHCYSTVDVEATSNGGTFIGGIAGKGEGDLVISYTYVTGNVKCSDITGSACVGGIMGRNTSSTIQNNLALNKEITTNNITIKTRFNRILGLMVREIPVNYATTRMTRNGKPASIGTDTDPISSGTDTWLNTFKEDLLKDPSDNNEWTTAWEWTDGKLPALKKRNSDGSYSTSLIAGQVPRQADDFLYHSPWTDNMAASIENAPPAGTTQPGNGLSPDSPILIKDAGELVYLAQQVNAGGYVLNLSNGDNIDNSSDDSKRGFSDYYFALSKDIELAGGLWTPIGEDSHSFCGHFDGKGHMVNGLRVEIVEDITSNNSVYAGLFGKVDKGMLCNLGVRLHEDGIKATPAHEGQAYAGGIAGCFSGNYGNVLLRNCFVIGNGKVEITAGYTGYAGGIAGAGNSSLHSATLTHCYATVDVETTTDYECFAGGIAGNSDGTLSYTYTTGSVRTNNATKQYAGGICGRSFGELTHNFALNSEVTVTNGTNSRRIASNNLNPVSLPGFYANYARPAMSLNNESGSTIITSLDGTSPNGADTWLDLFRSDLTNASAADEGWNSGNWLWPAAPASTLLPKLAVVTTDADGNDTGHYDPWPGLPAQPDLDAADYGLLPTPQLHIVQPADDSGTLTVTDAADPQGTPLDDGIPVRPGTTLKLSATPGSQYDFAAFLAGDAQATLSDHAAATIVMPSADLWLSARFNAQTPPPPPEPVYYTVTLPAVEGTATDPAPGNYAVKAWKNFSFYLTLDAAYDQSKPVVTTSNGETLIPRSSDGAYLVKSIRNDVQIFIDGIMPNDPTANAAIESGIRVWASDSRLCLRTDRAEDVRIYTFAGELRRSFRSAGGDQTVSLAPGSYIVRIGDSSFKIIL